MFDTAGDHNALYNGSRKSKDNRLASLMFPRGVCLMPKDVCPVGPTLDGPVRLPPGLEPYTGQDVSDECKKKLKLTGRARRLDMLFSVRGRLPAASTCRSCTSLHPEARFEVVTKRLSGITIRRCTTIDKDDCGIQETSADQRLRLGGEGGGF